MASLHRKPYIIALQLCTGRDSSHTRAGGLLGKRARSRGLWEKKEEGENNNNNNK